MDERNEVFEVEESNGRDYTALVGAGVVAAAGAAAYEGTKQLVKLGKKGFDRWVKPRWDEKKAKKAAKAEAENPEQK